MIENEQAIEEGNARFTVQKRKLFDWLASELKD